jgi:hypothetical protein
VEVGQDPAVTHFVQLIQSRPIYFETRRLEVPLLENEKIKRKIIKRKQERVKVAAHRLTTLFLYKRKSQRQQSKTR